MERPSQQEYEVETTTFITRTYRVFASSPQAAKRKIEYFGEKADIHFFYKDKLGKESISGIKEIEEIEED